jgi:hypothetical protein
MVSRLINYIGGTKMKKDIMILKDGKMDMIKGLFVVFGPFIVVMLIPIWWLRLLITIGIVAFWAMVLIKDYDSIVDTVEPSECVNRRIFGDIPMDCKIRRSTANVIETIDDLDFPNSRK